MTKLTGEKVAILLLGSIIIALLWGLHTQMLPSRYKKTSVNYGKDENRELYLYTVKIGSFSRAPHRSSRDNVDLRIQYIEGTSSKDREEIIEIQGWGFLAPLLPCKPFFLVAVLAICAGLLSRAKETLIRMFLSLMIIGYGAVLVATGIYGTFFVPGDALRNIENSSFGGLILYPLYGLSWLTFVLSLVTGVFIIARKKWAVAGGICVQAALFFSIPFTLSVAAGRPPCYRVEILSPVFYSSVSIPLLLLAVWFFTRSKVRARFTERRIDPTAFTP